MRSIISSSRGSQPFPAGIDMARQHLMVGIMPSANCSFQSARPARTNSAIAAVILLSLAAFLLQPNASAADVAPGNNTFAFDLYGQLKTNEGNLFFSPYSISTCLAMTYAGAHGQTAKEMAQTLHFDTNQSAFHAAFAKLQQQLNSVQQKKE